MTANPTPRKPNRTPLYPHTLQSINFVGSQQSENCCPHFNRRVPERRTLDGWLGSFFESREEDYEILYERLVLAIARTTKVDVAPKLVGSITSDDLDEMTQYLSQEEMLTIWTDILR